MEQVTNLKDVLRMPHKHYLVLGGDLRSLSLYHHLLNDGQSVGLFGFDHHPDENYKICHKKSMQNLICQADVVFNTVPHVLLERDHLKQITSTLCHSGRMIRLVRRHR